MEYKYFIKEVELSYEIWGEFEWEGLDEDD